MTPGPELLLAGLLLAFYLYDSAALVHCNEGFLEKGLRSKWSARFGSRKFTILGKEVFIAGLIPSHTAVFRLVWAMDGAAHEQPGWEQYAQKLRIFQVSSLALFVTVLMLLPLALLRRWGDLVLLSLILLIYAQISVALLLLWRSRKLLELSVREAFSLSAELLLCPPVAANLHRKLSLRHTVTEDFAAAAKRLLEPGQWSKAASEMILRIEDELEIESEGSKRHCNLQERKASLL